MNRDRVEAPTMDDLLNAASGKLLLKAFEWAERQLPQTNALSKEEVHLLERIVDLSHEIVSADYFER